MKGLSTKPLLVSLLSVLVENNAEHCKQPKEKVSAVFVFLPPSVCLLLGLNFLSTTSLEAKASKDKCEMQLAITVPNCVHQCFWELGFGGTSNQFFLRGLRPRTPALQRRNVLLI